MKELENILITYSQYNQDVRYLQGMNEIAGSFLRITQDETEAFWWLFSFMDIYVSLYLFILLVM